MAYKRLARAGLFLFAQNGRTLTVVSPECALVVFKQFNIKSYESSKVSSFIISSFIIKRLRLITNV